MTEEQYRYFSMGWVIYNRCGTSGQMPVETAAYGRTYLQSWAGAFTYDASRMDTWVSAITESPTAAVCNNAAMQAATWKRQVQEQNEMNAINAAQQQQLLNQLNNFGKTNQVYCNSIGTQTICNKY